MSRRVLLVDDEERVTSGVRRNLRRRFEIETCNDPRAALDLVTGQDEPFSVVVSDYQMPGMNGIDFLAQVRSITHEAVPRVTRWRLPSGPPSGSSSSSAPNMSCSS